MQRPDRETIYRLKGEEFRTVVKCAIGYAIATIVCSCFLFLPQKDTGPSPIAMAIFFGGFWFCWFLASLWFIAYHIRYRLIIDRKGIRQTGVFRSFFVSWQQIEKLRWYHFPHQGRITLKGDFRKMTIYFGNFTKEEVGELECIFSQAVSANKQIRKEEYLEARERFNNRAKNNIKLGKPAESLVFISLFLLSLFFIYHGITTHWLVLIGGIPLMCYAVARFVMTFRSDSDAA